MNKKTLVTIIFAVIVIISLNLYLLNSRNIETGSTINEIVKVEETLETKELLLLGTVKPEYEETFYINESLKLSEVIVEDNDIVESGDILVTYDTSDISIQKERLEIQKKINDISTTSIQRSINKKSKELTDLKEDKEIDKETKKERESLLRSEINDLVDQREISNLEEELLYLDDREIDISIPEDLKTNVDGIVTINNNTQSNSPEITVSSNNLTVYGEINEMQYVELTHDQEVIFTSKSLPNETWEGKIINKGRIINNFELEEERNYYFIASIENANLLEVGYELYSSVKTSEYKKILIPTTSIKEDENGDTYVYKNVNDKFEKNYIEISGDFKIEEEETEVLSGLENGDEILSNPESGNPEEVDVDNQ
ncbi:efflux RND transporter periplasmic adaptor subunit [Bacillus sp. A116_S68]|nr:efflux RND transporter periplasmic adaptor subunit [Bacillus sp. A116_S68]